MCQILNRLGVVAFETLWGIKIFGNPTAIEKEFDLSIPTYEDHWIAMAFGIASSLFKYARIWIENKSTV